ncbi:DNA topoisomerase IB [Rhodococcus phenolicus]|uniref:DNA topoisomerase IB n=1 Tax=Rhodococcus phenolicus TaxID=263849 RepID=UPI00082CF92C|nr:DNA topoisomerase IB [Rhodococcus phenolicus]
MNLRRSATSAPGIRRVRRGRGFAYLGVDGATVSATVRERIDALVIPPAWKQVWICPHGNGHIQAFGTDVAGRRQYLYHEQWRAERDEEKHDRVLTMAARLPKWRKQVQDDLVRRGAGRRRVEAVALRLLDRAVFRVGGEEYAEENGTHGVATLLRSHVRISGGVLTFDYPAKGGIRRVVAVDDADLATAVRALRRVPSESGRLLVYRDGDTVRELHADDVNARFKELAGDDCSAKDLRTWNATVLAAAAFAEQDPPADDRARAHAEAEVMRRVAEELGNTPAVARGSYVDPRVVTAYEQGRTVRAALRRAARTGSDDEARGIVERAVIRLLGRV